MFSYGRTELSRSGSRRREKDEGEPGNSSLTLLQSRLELQVGGAPGEAVQALPQGAGQEPNPGLGDDGGVVPRHGVYLYAFLRQVAPSEIPVVDGAGGCRVARNRVIRPG